MTRTLRRRRGAAACPLRQGRLGWDGGLGCGRDKISAARWPPCPTVLNRASLPHCAAAVDSLSHARSLPRRICRVCSQATKSLQCQTGDGYDDGLLTPRIRRQMSNVRGLHCKNFLV